MKKKELPEIFKKILDTFKNFLNFIGAKLKKFDTNYPETSKTIQLTFIYFFSIIDLITSYLNLFLFIGQVLIVRS